MPAPCSTLSTPNESFQTSRNALESGCFLAAGASVCAITSKFSWLTFKFGGKMMHFILLKHLLNLVDERKENVSRWNQQSVQQIALVGFTICVWVIPFKWMRRNLLSDPFKVTAKENLWPHDAFFNWEAEYLKVPGSVPGFGTKQKTQSCGTKNDLVVKQVLGHALEQGTKDLKAQCNCRGLLSHVLCFNKQEFPVWSQYSFFYFLPFVLHLNDTPRAGVKQNFSIVSLFTT